MIHLAVALLTVLGLALVHRIVRETAPAAAAAWAVVALALATNLWPTLTEGSREALAGAFSFAAASVALFLWWGRRRGDAVRSLASAAAGLLAVVMPYAQAGERPAVALTELGQALFAPTHGLLSWSPILWGGVAGTASLVASHRWRAGVAALAAAVTLVAAAGAESVGPLAGARFHATLPVFGVGLGRSLAWLQAAISRRPALPLAAGAAALTLWNALFMEQYRTNRIPRDLPVRFADVTRNNAAILAQAVGSPNAWPVNWLFAWRYGVSPAKYDVVVGQARWPRAFVAINDPRLDPHLLAEGWGPRTLCNALPCRGVAGSARILLALDAVEVAPTALRVAGPATVLVAVNRVSFLTRASTGVTELSLPQAAAWRRGVNELQLTSEPGARLRVLGLRFGPPDGE